MKRLLLTCGALSLIAGVQTAQATVTKYNVTETFYEPDTQPNNTIFTGSFYFDSITKTISNLTGTLTESMTGTPMATVPLSYQLSAVSDGAGGLLVTAFLLNTTNTFTTIYGGNGWTPGTGYGLYYGFPTAKNPFLGGVGNAYAMIDVNLSDPTKALTSAQIDKLAYADCTKLGMMGPTCMTGTTVAGYGSIGTMGGYPVSQSITAAVPEPETYAMMMAGLGLIGFVSRRRKSALSAA